MDYEVGLISRVVTGPVLEPVSLDEAKLQLRVDIDTDDALISRIIQGARETLEERLGMALITQTRDLYGLTFPAETVLTLPYGPVQSVTGVYYTETDSSSELTFAAASYLSQTWRNAIVLKSGYAWPTDATMRVRYVCGYTSAGLIPQRLRQALLLLVGHWYENREGTQTGALKEIPLAVEALINLERVHWGL